MIETVLSIAWLFSMNGNWFRAAEVCPAGSHLFYQVGEYDSASDQYRFTYDYDLAGLRANCPELDHIPVLMETWDATAGVWYGEMVPTHDYPLWGADLNKSDSINVADWLVFSGCYNKAATGGCVIADMNLSGGTVNATDYLLFMGFYSP